MISDFPTCPTTEIIADKDLLLYTKQKLQSKNTDDKLQGRVKTVKLVPNLYEKRKIILHYRALTRYKHNENLEY